MGPDTNCSPSATSLCSQPSRTSTRAPAWPYRRLSPPVRHPQPVLPWLHRGLSEQQPPPLSRSGEGHDVGGPSPPCPREGGGQCCRPSQEQDPWQRSAHLLTAPPRQNKGHLRCPPLPAHCGHLSSLLSGLSSEEGRSSLPTPSPSPPAGHRAAMSPSLLEAPLRDTFCTRPRARLARCKFSAELSFAQSFFPVCKLLEQTWSQLAAGLISI